METVDRYHAKSLNIKTVNALEINTVWKYVHMNDQKSIRKPPTKSINTKLFKQNAPQSAEMQGKELLPHEAMHNSSLCSLSVCPSVTFEMNKHIFKIFSLPVSHTIPVFPHQTLWQYSNADPLMRTLNAGGVGKNRNSRPVSGFGIITGRVSSTISSVD